MSTVQPGSQPSTASQTTNSISTLNCPYELTNEKVVFSGRWMKAKQVNFKLRGTATTGVWQSAHRNHSGHGHLPCDGVDVIATVKRAGHPRSIILVKQFRIPIMRWIIEFPAGLIDRNDTSPLEAGIRELKEETGYTASKVVSSTTKGPYLNPGLSSDNSAICVVEVDGDAPENQNPQQALDGDESIEVIVTPLDGLLGYLDGLLVSGEAEVSTQVYSFAVARVV